MNERKITERRYLFDSIDGDSDGPEKIPLQQFLADLQKIRDEIPQELLADATIEFATGYDSDYISSEICWQRPENDEDRRKREEADKARIERDRASRAQANAARYAQYLALKKEFEPAPGL